MNIPVKICITQTSSDVIKIELHDPAARIRFAEIEMTPHDFAMAITGLGYISSTATLDGLDKVGKIRVSEKRSKVCRDPECKYSREKCEAWLIEHAQEEGWEIQTYLGSKDSRVSTDDGAGVVLNYSVFRWEDHP